MEVTRAPELTHRSGNRLGFSTDLKTARLNTGKAVEAFAFLSRLYQLAYPPTTVYYSTNYGNPYKLAQGIVSMAFGGPDLLQYASTQNRQWQTEIGFFAPRRSPGLEPKVQAYWNAITIMQSSKDPDAAWEFIQWLMKPEITVLYHSMTWSLPTRSDVADQFTKAAPHLLSWYKALQYFSVEDSHELGMAISSEKDVYMRALSGQVDARTAMEQVNRRLQNTLDETWARVQSRL